MLMDLALSRRLERAEGLVGVSFIPARIAVTGTPAEAREIAGAVAIFDGVDSPLTQSFGLGLTEAVTPEAIPELEAFFFERGAPAMHEVSPLAGIATTQLLVARGYQPIELSTVLVQALDAHALPPPSLPVRIVDPARDANVFVETSVAGWSAEAGVSDFIRTLTEVSLVNTSMTHFMVEHAGAAIATGSLGIQDDIALLVGASTVPAARGQGAQASLLAARLGAARARGCTIAMMVAEAGSTSQRNAERRGFRVAYTRTKWQRTRP